jgi:hypothetical protein
MAKQEPGERDQGIASPTRGPQELTPEHIRKTDGQVLPARVPPPDAEMYPTDTPETTR